ncbi:MAG: hypothetical protein OHK006_08550 [Thermodesulfovibrionales bacterium]
MAAETILVIDADQETEQKIISTLEAEGYLVFSGSSQVVTQEMAAKLRPSLIYLKPLAPSAAGFEPCKQIHNIPFLKDVPIIILATIKGSLDPRYTTYYGIVDFLNPTFTPEDLIKKTEMFLEFMRPAPGFERHEAPEEPAEDGDVKAEPAGFGAAPGEPALPVEPELPEEPEIPVQPVFREPELPREEPAPAQQKPRPAPAQRKQNPFEEEEPWGRGPAVSAPVKHSSSPVYSSAAVQRRKSPLLPVLIVVLVLALLGGGGFLAYLFVPQVRDMVQGLTGTAPKQVQTAAKPAEPLPMPAPQPVPAAPAPEPPAQPAAAAPAAPAQAVQPKTPAAPAQPSAPSIPAASQHKPFFAVQVGAFKTKEIAADLVKNLKAKGFEAYAQEGVARDKSPIVRVLVGRFDKREPAALLAREIQSKERMQTTIYHGE